MKQKFAYHITTAIHDSRTSQRMIDYCARERRFDGEKPLPDVNYMSKEIEELIAVTVSEIVNEEKLTIAAFNLCRDHMHILRMCRGRSSKNHAQSKRKNCQGLQQVDRQQQWESPQQGD